MTPSKDTVAYAASCNPPRRAKRARTDADPAPSASHQLRPQLLPRDPAPARPAESSSDEEDAYDPAAAAPAPKRRGRKPGPLSRSARESQRKLNHSRIEKARRTKINETLATLSALVNANEAEKAGGVENVEKEREKEKEKERGGEKEFKLDVLVKTVSYIQELLHKVKTLEAGSCAQCAGDMGASVSADTAGAKRKRPANEDVDAGEDDDEIEIVRVARSLHSDAAHAVSELPSPPHPPSRATSRAPGPSPCLPPISAWLPHPYVDPSCLSDGLPSPSPSVHAQPQSQSQAQGQAQSPRQTQPMQLQLPTPPLSGSFRTPLSVPAAALPALSLPGPAHPLPPPLAASYSHSYSHSQTRSPTHAHPSSHSHGQGHAHGHAHAHASYPPSPTSQRLPAPRRMSSGSTRSPPWTPEDETAASLLLQMSSSPASSVSSVSSVSGSGSGGPVSGSVRGTTPKMSGRALEGASRGKRVEYAQERVQGQERGQMRAETPGSLLGLGVGRGA
ncbi:hypothetical protein EIP86_009335 [Pleurotus ostreatoroseus]|nr:hypothetical protein EIP86_009335 [Pleurotus ostreatoroseus]